MRLADFARALYEEADAPADRSDDTRARVIAKLERAGRRRTRRVLFALPIAAVLAGATASAAVGGKLPAAWHSFAHALGLPSRAPAANESKPSPAATVVPSEPARADALDSIAPPVSDPSAHPPNPPRAAPNPSPRAGSKAARNAAPMAGAEKGPKLRVEGAPDSLGLYRAAHRLHFSGHDPAAALVAWDAYLAHDPAGAFALEAKYNRAICLVRLGRSSDAREALAPFASGEVGGYRKSEARALLSLLDRESEAK